MSIYNNRSKANDCNLEIVWWMFDKYYRQQPNYNWAGKKMGIIVTLTNDQLLALTKLYPNKLNYTMENICIFAPIIL